MKDRSFCLFVCLPNLLVIDLFYLLRNKKKIACTFFEIKRILNNEVGLNAFKLFELNEKIISSSC